MFLLLCISLVLHEFIEMSRAKIKILRVRMEEFVCRSLLYTWIPNDVKGPTDGLNISTDSSTGKVLLSIDTTTSGHCPRTENYNQREERREWKQRFHFSLNLKWKKKKSPNLTELTASVKGKPNTFLSIRWEYGLRWKLRLVIGK